MKCDTLCALYGEPFPFRPPVREVAPLEQSSLASEGGLQPETFSSIRFQIYRVGKL